MIDKLNDTWSFLAIEDFRFFLLIAKKNIKNLVISTTLVSIFVLFISLNLEKKFISKTCLFCLAPRVLDRHRSTLTSTNLMPSHPLRQNHPLAQRTRRRWN